MKKESLQKISYSAPGKVIFGGEHAVLYGRPALVCAADLRLKFTVFKTKTQLKNKLYMQIAAIVKKYFTKKNIVFTDSSFSCTIDSNISKSAGLGSSAALSTAASAAFLEFFSGRQFEKEIINNIAYSVEKLFHKNPSGADNSTSCFGGIVFYRKEFEFLKTISLLQCKIPKNIESHLFLIQSGHPVETTRIMIDIVGKKYNENTTQIEDAFNKIEKCVKRMTVALYKEDAVFFRSAVLENQQNLEKLGVVSPTTQKLLVQLSQFGVGKITGAGGVKKGSGYVLFYADEPEIFQEYARSQNLDYFPFKQSHEGVVKINV